ncbi:MAG: 50S ribosomal protein L6 [Candidatus Altiarchaeota archaeon]
MTDTKEKKKKSKKDKKKGIELEIQIPDGIQASVEDRKIRIKGPHGELVKSLQSRTVKAKSEGNKIILNVSRDRRKERALIHTEKGGIMNLIHGVRDMVTYRLKVLFSHFPMGLKVQGNTLLIDNFLGERHPRKAKLLGDVKVEVKGQDVTVSGIDKEKVAQTAANIEQITKIKNLDPRVFQDGIYIIEKDGKPVR